ncbi:Unknown protein [Striga hermonthica]|uniref:Uncharacterized protein n=1 Tax=Striga hermonthica TaxID=68872 RepID=A0A9N7MMX7_STRHE|nr:Unknown protein [Striga hermonthica]
MNRCAIQQSSFGACEEIWAAGRCMEKKETVVCPKPRRLGLAHATLDPSYARPLRWHMSHQQEDCDSRAGNELLDIILAKGNNCGNSEQTQSPPFFSGSPPASATIAAKVVTPGGAGSAKATEGSPIGSEFEGKGLK